MFLIRWCPVLGLVVVLWTCGGYFRQFGWLLLLAFLLGETISCLRWLFSSIWGLAVILYGVVSSTNTEAEERRRLVSRLVGGRQAQALAYLYNSGWRIDDMVEAKRLLFRAVVRSDYEIVKVLLCAGADPNYHFSVWLRRTTLLHTACRTGSIKVSGWLRSSFELCNRIEQGLRILRPYD